MVSEDTFIFSVLLQTKILPPIMSGLGVYVTKQVKYAMVKFIKHVCCAVLYLYNRREAKHTVGALV